MSKRLIVLDATTLHVGGGVGVGVAVIEAAALDQRFDWVVWTSPAVDARLPLGIKHKFRSYKCFSFLTLMSKLTAVRQLKRLETRLHPHIVYTIFGPAYWKPRAFHIQGFARVMALYPQCCREAGGTRIQGAILWLKNLVLLSRFKHSDAIVTETDTVRRLFCQKTGFDETRVYRIPNTFRAAFDAFDFRQDESRHNRFRFFSPSAPYPHKNHIRQVWAALELTKTCDADFELVFTIPEASPAWRRISSLSHALGISDRVKTCGHLDLAGLLRQYRDSTAVLFMTLCECSSSVYPEAFAAGRPVISSNRDFVREVCESAALYADPLSPPDIARAMRLLIMQPGKSVELISAGRKQLKAVYCAPAARDEYHLAILEKVTKQTMGPKG